MNFLVLLLLSFISFSAYANEMDPQEHFFKAKMHLIDGVPTFQEKQEVRESAKKGEFKKYLEKKVDEWLLSLDHAYKMSYRINELIGTRVPQTLEIFNHRELSPERGMTTMNQFIGAKVLANRTWDEIFTGGDYQMSYGTGAYSFRSELGFYQDVVPRNEEPFSSILRPNGEILGYLGEGSDYRLINHSFSSGRS